MGPRDHAQIPPHWPATLRAGPTERTGTEMRRVVHYAVTWPVVFAAGWLFNFIADVRFAAGFVSGWLAHSWIGNLF